MRCAGALPPLVSMLQESDTDLQSWAVDAMQRTAWDESSFDAILTAGMGAVCLSRSAEPSCSCDQLQAASSTE